MIAKYKGDAEVSKYKEYLMRETAVKLLDIDDARKKLAYKNESLKYYENQEKKYGEFNYYHLIAVLSSKIDIRVEKIIQTHCHDLRNHLDLVEIKIHSKKECECNKYMIDAVFKENDKEIASENILSLSMDKDNTNKKVLNALLIGLANNSSRYIEAHGYRYIDREKYIETQIVNSF